MLKKILYLVLAVFAAGLIWAVYFVFFTAPPGLSMEERAQILKEPRLHIENFVFDPSSSFESRIQAPPDFMLAFLRKNDKSPNYEPYALTRKQKKLVVSYLESLPYRIRTTLKERLVGIYFIENFTGNGLSDVVLGPGDKRYAWMVVNPAGLKKTLSEILTEKENTVFGTAGAVKVDCGSALPGVLHALAHEGAHAFDYISKATPYVTPWWYDVEMGELPGYHPWGVWDAYNLPGRRSDFKLRNKLKFYGLGGERLLKPRDAAELYSGLAGSPFVSLYGSQNWAEDFAEQIVYGCLKSRLGRACVITYPAGEKTGELVPGRIADLRAMEIYNSLSGKEGAGGEK